MFSAGVIGQVEVKMHKSKKIMRTPPRRVELETAGGR